ncbi:MAG: aminotransferase class V-fold PLP-dependent enzyme [Bacteroidota bacterium]
MLSCQKQLFDIPAHVCYLNTAYMSPQLKAVEEAGQRGLARKNRPFDILPRDFFEPAQQLKQQFANFIGVADSQRIAVVPSVSYGMANVANNLNLRAGDEIVLVADQFPSNVFSWERAAKKAGAYIRTVRAPMDKADRGRKWNQAILDAIGEKTALVALPHIHWSQGIVFDLAAIREKTWKYHALLVVDGTQSVGAYPFSNVDFQLDTLVCATYKWLLGPYSFGLAYYGPAFDEGKPIEESWINRLNSEDFSSLTQYQEQYKRAANRYCVGEYSNFIMVPMAIKALEFLSEWDAAAIQAYCSNIQAKAIESLLAEGFHIAEAAQRCAHLIGIELPAHLDHQQLKQRLKQENILVSLRGNFMRVAPYLFNEVSDFEKLLAVLK